jgi:hypothetical protein
MEYRQVNLIQKDRHGNITALCNPGEDWSPRKKEDAIRDIESNTHRYYVTWAGSGGSHIQVVDGPEGKYLRTDKDKTERNNLDDLPSADIAF